MISNSIQTKVLRLTQVLKILALSRSTLYEKLNPKSKRYDPSFPRGFKLSSSAIGWRESDIVAWIDSKVNLAMSEQGGVISQ